MYSRDWILTFSLVLLMVPTAGAVPKDPAPGTVSCKCKCQYVDRLRQTIAQPKVVGSLGKWSGTRTSCQAYTGSSCTVIHEDGSKVDGKLDKCNTHVHKKRPPLRPALKATPMRAAPSAPSVRRDPRTKSFGTWAPIKKSAPAKEKMSEEKCLRQLSGTIKRMGIKPDRKTYSTARRYCAKGDLRGAINVIKQGKPATVRNQKCTNPRPQICTREYRPVCATKDTGVRCITTPCQSTEEITYATGCTACADPKVSHYRLGKCKQ